MALSHCLHLATFCSTESKKRSFRSLQTAIPLSGGAGGDQAGRCRGIAVRKTLERHTFDAFASTWLSSADGYRWSVNSELLVPNPYAVESASVVSFYQDNYIRHGVALSYGPFILFELSTPVFVGPDSSLCVHVTTLPPDNILRYVGTIQISLPTGTLSIVISTVSASIYGCGISPHMVDEEQILIRVVVPVP